MGSGDVLRHPLVVASGRGFRTHPGRDDVPREIGGRHRVVGEHGLHGRVKLTARRLRAETTASSNRTLRSRYSVGGAGYRPRRSSLAPPGDGPGSCRTIGTERTGDHSPHPGSKGCRRTGQTAARRHRSLVSEGWCSTSAMRGEASCRLSGRQTGCHRATRRSDV
jgi:hypothetical protein